MAISVKVQTWVKNYHAESYAWALRCCHQNRDEAADVLQNAYIKVLENRASFANHQAFKAWLFTVIRNKAIDMHRMRQRRQRHRRKAQKFVELSVENEAVTKENKQPSLIIQKALESCSEMQQQVLQLVFYHDTTLKDAAKILGISLGSAHTHYDRGKKRLKSFLEKHRDLNKRMP